MKVQDDITLDRLLEQGVITGTTHLGGSLQRMVESYGQLMAVGGELIQNSIDVNFGGATHISFEIDFDRGIARYYDNGGGLSPTTLVTALNSVGKTTKDTKKFGKFGVGFASPISIFERFFVVTASSGYEYAQVELNTKKLFATARDFVFPIAKAENTFHEDGKTPGYKSGGRTVWWRTFFEMQGLIKDKAKRRFDLDEFRNDIQTRFSQKLAMLGTSIKVVLFECGKKQEVKFKAKLYNGKQLPVWERVFPDVGNVSVGFYLVPHGYKGKQNMGFAGGDNPSLIPINHLKYSPFMVKLDAKTKEAINSGMFQGEVIAEKMVIAVDRISFERGDAHDGLTQALDTWYQEVGAKYYENEKEKRAATRHQLLAKEALEGLELEGYFSKDSPFASLLAQAEYGSVGRGNSSTGKDSVIQGSAMKAKVVTKEGEGPSDHGSGTSSKRGPDPKHQPAVVIGPEGGVRQVVKNRSLGPHILPEDIGTKLWHFDVRSLCLRVNPTHPLFALIDRSDSKVRDLYMYLIITSFGVALQPPEVQHFVQTYAEAQTADWVRKMLAK